MTRGCASRAGGPAPSCPHILLARPGGRGPFWGGLGGRRQGRQHRQSLYRGSAASRAQQKSTFPPSCLQRGRAAEPWHLSRAGELEPRERSLGRKHLKVHFGSSPASPSPWVADEHSRARLHFSYATPPAPRQGAPGALWHRVLLLLLLHGYSVSLHQKVN